MEKGVNIYIVLNVLVSTYRGVAAKPPLEIVNGATAAEGELPYMVQLCIGPEMLACGGSIIGAEWILTAGHCIGNLDENSTIIYGTTKLYGDGTPNTTRAIKNWFRHPKFTHNTSSTVNIPIYDVGIIQLEDTIVFSKYAQPIQLAEADAEIPVHVDGILSGWGGTSLHVVLPEYLQKINLQLLTDKECTEKVNGYSKLDIFNPTHNVCTNDHFNGGCYGDSGSPYVINGTQYALVSWSYKPCWGVVPNAHSRITNPEYRNWIKNITNI